jgi:hypothetical protein
MFPKFKILKNKKEKISDSAIKIGGGGGGKALRLVSCLWDGILSILSKGLYS